MQDRIERDANIMQLLRGLAHEISTPLGAIKCNNENVELAFRKIGEWMKTLPESALEPDVKEVFHIVEASIRTNRLALDRVIAIVSNVRNFARLEDAESRKADIHESLDSTLALLAHKLKNRITVVKEYGQVRQLDCYPGQLHQVFMNIILNAAQAIEGEGEIRIKTWEADKAVQIAISDTGKGIPPDVQPRIFDAGFTTKKADAGAGLGLAICHKIIRNHNGRIEMESIAGKGSTFTIVLPISKDMEEEANG